MNSRDKARLFHELGQLLRAGFPLPRALEKLMKFSRGGAVIALREVAVVLARGGTAGEAMSAPAAFSGLDAAIFSSSDSAGKLEKGLALAAEYHDTMAAARSRILTKTAYPLFIVHFAGLAFALPKLVMPDGGEGAFVSALALNFGVLWGVVLALWLLSRLVAALAAKVPVVDHLLGALPLFGKLRRGFALSRFCLAYDMQMEAGINVFSALTMAAAAAGGAAHRSAAQQAAALVREGAPLSTALAKSGVFPEPLLRCFSVGESTGQLEAELRRAATDYRDASVKRIEILVEWMPRVALIVVGVFIGFRVVDFYTKQMSAVQSMGL